jgi:hypothetical protein
LLIIVSKGRRWYLWNIGRYKCLCFFEVDILKVSSRAPFPPFIRLFLSGQSEVVIIFIDLIFRVLVCRLPLQSLSVAEAATLGSLPLFLTDLCMIWCLRLLSRRGVGRFCLKWCLDGFGDCGYTLRGRLIWYLVILFLIASQLFSPTDLIRWLLLMQFWHFFESFFTDFRLCTRSLRFDRLTATIFSASFLRIHHDKWWRGRLLRIRCGHLEWGRTDTDPREGIREGSERVTTARWDNRLGALSEVQNWGRLRKERHIELEGRRGFLLGPLWELSWLLKEEWLGRSLH